MLTRISISNYAIITNTEITFNEGFSVLTGETGAGKSILLNALNMILGERLDLKQISNREKKSIVEAEFDISKYNLKGLFESNDIDFDNTCILRREVSTAGKSRAFINDTPVNASVMKEISSRLIDIHSQHNNLLLFNQSYQLSLIDGIAKNSEIRAKYSNVYNEFLQSEKRLKQQIAAVEQAKKDEDYFRFILNQLAPLALQPGEEETLESQQKSLENVEEIKRVLWTASDILNGENASVLSNLKESHSQLLSIAGLIDNGQELCDRIDSAIIELRDIQTTLNEINDKVIDDPAELERVNNRLSAIYNLKIKHNAKNIDELLAIQHDYEAKLSMIDSSEFDMKALQKEYDECRKQLASIAEELTASRNNAASLVENELIARASLLGMKNIKCKFEFTKCDFNHNGQDKVRLMVAFNKNQQLEDVASTASGGELSRVMLCLKSIVAQHIEMPTLIFDEIDTGVSGEIANRMGAMMKEISANIQVIAITHLPQVAALGAHHYKVFKIDNENSTESTVKLLNADERITEIAGMIAGETINEAAISNAKSLLKICNTDL